jgi:hypothetical protein
MIFNCTISLIAMTLVYKLDSNVGRMCALPFAATFAVNIPLSLSIITSNVTGYTKRSTTSALLFISYCLGNIVGPQFFFTREAPKYDTGIKSSLAGYAFGVFFLVVMYVYYMWENARRDRLYGPPKTEVDGEEVQGTKTDRQDKNFRYML